jgi:L-fucose isomerase-like protein
MKEIVLIASGDSRIDANTTCWPAQAEMESLIEKALNTFGYTIKRAHAFDAVKNHGLIDSQKMGIEVFKNINEHAPLIVAESLWQYSHHVLAGLTTHKGPIITIANWSGQWPGLVGLLNLNGSLTKAGVSYSTLWSEKFTDTFFLNGLKEWLDTGKIKHDCSHVKNYDLVKIPLDDEMVGKNYAHNFKKNKSIMGVFDEGCMGMYNAIIPDEILHQTGVFKERLSQSALFAEMQLVKEDESNAVLEWLLQRGMQFSFGTNEATELTKNQTLEQCKMYIAAVRLADYFGCATIGIQYQQGLKDICAASDLVEGLLNNKERPRVFDKNGNELFANNAIPHFNEVDECAGLDGLITYQLWNKLGMSGENTLHDLRWGQHYKSETIDEFVWVFLISGAAPAAHFVDGYKSASSERQPAMFFPKGGGTLKGNSKPGPIVWSRIYVEDNKLNCDLGVGNVVELPAAETQRRWDATTSQWPIMHAVIHGVSQNQMMAKHKANHIQVAYTDTVEMAHKACRIKAAALHELGISVNFCGEVSFN